MGQSRVQGRVRRSHISNFVVDHSPTFLLEGSATLLLQASSSLRGYVASVELLGMRPILLHHRGYDLVRGVLGVYS